MELEEPGTDLPAPFTWRSTLLAGIVMLVLGLIVSFHPSAALNTIAVLLGILMIVSGIAHLVRMFGRTEVHRIWLGIAGLTLVVIGVVLIRHLHLTVAVIGLIVGIGWILQGLSTFLTGVTDKSGEGRAWWIIFGLVSLIAGIVVVAAPTSSARVLAILTGIWFAVMGLFQIASGFMLRHAIRKSRSAGGLLSPKPLKPLFS